MTGYKADNSLLRKNTNNSYTFLYMASNIREGIGSVLWQGALKKIRETDINLICYMGGGLGDDNRSLVYNLINKDKIDGFISHAVGDKDMHLSFYNQFKGYPFVALSVPIPGFPVVMADSYHGMRDVVEHLIMEHSYTKIAFVQGPATHVYAAQRYSAYIDVVKENRIYDENLITPPLYFDVESGVKGIKILLDERKLKPGKDIEAVVFVSDNCAIGAFDELTSRKIKIPEQLALTGYNALPEAFCKSPPITTVAMPFEEQSRKAVDLLIKLNRNEEIPMKTILPAKLLVAQSCGCQSLAVKNAAANMETLKHKENNLIFINDKNSSKIMSKTGVTEEIITGLKEYAQNNKIEWSELEEYSKILLKSVFNEIKDRRQGEFLLRFNEFISKLINEKRGIDFLQDIISIFRKGFIIYTKEANKFHIAEDLWSQARIMTAEASSRVKENNFITRRKREENIRYISVNLLSSYDIGMLMNILAQNLPKLDIPGCYISIYQNTDDVKSVFSVPENARLIFAYENGKRKKLKAGGIHYRSKELLPEGFSVNCKQKITVVHSLIFNNAQIGFVIFKLGAEEGSVYYILSNLLSSAIKGALLVDETIRNSKELNEAYQNLKHNQMKLLLAEKMASLGRLTARISHEMNTPLASILASMRELKNLVDEYRCSIDSPDVFPEDHKQIAKEMERNIEISIKATEKNIGFIKVIRGQTTSMNTNKTEKFNAGRVIFDTLNLLEFKLKYSNCIIMTEIDDSIILSGNPNGLSQIVTNLINNALEASGDTKVKITVKLSSLKNKYAKLIVEDNGPGIPKENLIRIFDPFFSTKPFADSSGLGLKIVKDLVEQFTGTIKVKSNSRVTQFVIKLPLLECTR